jgi:hypothetical protein
MSTPKTYEMEMAADELSNLAWCRLHDLMSDGLGNKEPALEEISEAEIMLQFKRAVANKSDFVMIRLRYRA